MNYIKPYIVLFLSITISTQSGAENQPNILFIIADDMGVDAINGYNIGTNLPHTPSLDKLRTQGVTFTNAWAAPVCAATRASLITGKYGINNGVNTLPGHLKTEHKTIFTEIAEIAPEYETCFVGKWHLSKGNNIQHPKMHGINHFMGVLSNGVADYNKWLKVENNVQDTCYQYATRYFTDYAVEWIAQQTQPWFMWLAHVAPHSPYHNPPAQMYSTPTNNSPKQNYKAMIESLDYEIGRMLDSIPQDVLENTIVMFMGDNGTPGNVLQGFPSGHGKQTLYQGGINVPMIIAGNGVTRLNETENALVNVSDFYATVAQLVNNESYPTGNVHDSYSFKHLLNGEPGTSRTFNYMELGANTSVPNNIYTTRNTRYKLIDTGKGSFEMYDLQKDPFELNNVLDGEMSSELLAEKEALKNQMYAIRGLETEKEDTANSAMGKAGKYPIVHTGVSDFYDENSIISRPEMSESIYGQDAGRVQNTPSYTDHKNGTVTDHVTELMWQQTMGEKMTYSEAVEAANSSLLGGHSDWRIPTIKELYSLIQFNGRVFGEKAMASFIDTDYFDQPLGNTSAGEREIDAQTWTSTHYTGLTMRADTTVFGVNFVDGRIKGYPKYHPRTGAANLMYFRLVRGNTGYGKNKFVDNGNGTVTDSATHLMWQQADDGEARNWLHSINYCEDLELGGHDDWHLPNAKELQSLVDYERSPSATNSAAIDPVFSISTIDDPEGEAGHYPYFWSTSPHLDGPNPYTTAVYVAFGEALGQMNGNLLDVHGAGAQRSDPKKGNPVDYPTYYGPQGDVQMVYNHSRCVRNMDEVTANNTVVQDKFKIKVYPNPSQNSVTISIPSLEKPVQLSIYGTNNQIYQQLMLTQHETLIHTDELLSGMYLFVLKSDDSEKTVKKMMKL